MIKEINKITNNNVDLKNLQENHLSIQLSLDGFSFCIYNKIQEEIGAFVVYEFDDTSISPYKHLALIEELFEQETLLQEKFHTVSVTHHNNLVTQVPQPFFDKNKLASYLQYTIKVLENDFITYDKISNSEIVNVYIPFVNVNNFLLDKYGSFIYKHASTILIEKLLNVYKHTEEVIFFINVTKTNFDTVVFKNKKLELFNSFHFKTKEDFIYYVLFITEQLNLNPEEFKLVLLGDIEKNADIYNILYQYIRNISFYSPTNFPSILKNISPHSHFTLLNQI
ncbi:DUF3822 family protein [Lutibacter sp.]|uniref:DUF3822 family protein n=1 Tax=Lutibacter sp. TaxID=1925666 RepID=UPI0025C63966|nr:DUF3822 family protein [Lutibacter sp.]MCF6167308.1 DUF3822 family protein [Lutibacter sp.]